MSLKKLANGSWQVYTYDPATRSKKYRGVRPSKREARELERELLTAGKPRSGQLTVGEYAEHWLEHHHGPGSRRPAATTRQVNAMNLRRFLTEYQDVALDGITRREALRWSRLPGNQHRAKTVSAMFNDAIDDQETDSNPFANRRMKEQRGRRDIHPLTEAEVDRLAGIARDRWGADGYGLVFRAAILFGAWVGTRPGETFGVTWRDLDLRDGLVTVRRVKPPHNTDTVVMASPVVDAVQRMPRVPNDEGLVFPTIRGLRVQKGALRYLWDPVRSAFRAATSSERWAQLCEGQPDLDFYVLRHFAASIIVARGGNEYDVAAQLGNTPEVARERYVHSYEDRQRDRLRGLLERPAPVVDLRERRGA